MRDAVAAAVSEKRGGAAKAERLAHTCRMNRGEIYGTDISTQ